MIKTAASAAMAQMQATPWAIHPPALAQIVSALEVIAATGQPLCRVVKSSVDLDLQLIAAGPVDADAIVKRSAGETLESVLAAEYSRKVQRSGNVAVIPVVGVIEPEQGIYSQYLGGTACSQLRSDLRISATDPSVREIWLVIDSPGGSAMGLAETARVIAEVAGKKPVVAYCRNLCASAAYFLASQAARIVATESTLVGSVGTIIDHMSYAGWLEQMGVKNSPITFGKNKGEGSPYRDLSTSAREGLQATVDAFGKQFVAAVARGRKTTPDNVMERYGQGRVFIAAEAMERGMIDAIGLVEESNSAGGGGGGVQSRIVSQVSAALPSSMSTPQPTNQSGPASLPSGSSMKSEPPKVKKLTALLYGLGMVQTLEASAESVDAAITSFCFARGVAVPRNADNTLDETACVALLNGAKPAASNQPAAPAATSQNAGPVSPATVDPVAEFKARGNELRAIAASMNAGRTNAVVTSEQITEAIMSDEPLATVREKWTKALEASETGTPIGNLSISGGRSGEEAFATGAVDAIMARMGYEVESKVPADMRSISLFDVGLRAAAVNGQRLSGTREDQAVAILQQGGTSLTVLGADSGAYNRPGSFPNILANLVGKILDTSMELAEATYPAWTDRMMDVPDFNPRTVMAGALFDSLDQLPDGDKTKELRMAEELLGWFGNDVFANHVKLTPKMLANDDLDAFNQMLNGLGMAHELTLNGLCLQLLAGNVTLVDGVALFHSSHNNLVSGSPQGGVPSQTTADANRLKHRKQTGVGATRSLSSRPRVALVPTDLESAAQQTYYTLAQLVQMSGGESKMANTDANINVHRGTVDVVCDPGLDAYSTAMWYTFDTNMRTIVHGFQTGYGRGGRRTSWVDPDSGCRFFKLEGRFGAAAVGYRGAVRNNGS
jgi:capsid assembly protease